MSDHRCEDQPMTTQEVLFEDLLNALVLEESEPSYAALERWSERYPERREALAAFFATWAVQAELSQETPVDEERLANLAVSHALDIAYREDAVGNRVILDYLDEKISLGRAAEVLGISRFELTECFERLRIPLRIGSLDLAEARDEVRAARRARG